MPPGAEMLGNGAIRGQESLGMTRRLKPLHAILTLTRGTMGILTPVVQITTLAMLHPRQDVALRRAITLELVREDHPWHVLQALEQLAKKLLGRVLVAPTLHQDIEDVIVLIDSAP